MSLQENQSTPAPTGATQPERAFQVEARLRVSARAIAIAACVVILLLITTTLYAGFNSMLPPLVMLLGIAAACASLVSRGRIKVRSRRVAITPDEVGNLPDDIRLLIPAGAKRVYDLKDLPPNLAANPEVRKLFERAGARGAWVKIESPGHSSIAGLDDAAGQAENATGREPGNVQPAKVDKRVTRISFMVSDKAGEPGIPDIGSDAIATASSGNKIEPAAFGPSVTSFLSKAIAFAACLLIFAALAAVAVAWISLKGAAPAH
ncbi:MAG TPA: hypothetical protein VKT27_16520 [Candidatus Binataceae bacterium]|nr:hypothetical protein [Candidatus Binataceae bacterium]